MGKMSFREMDDAIRSHINKKEAERLASPRGVCCGQPIGPDTRGGWYHLPPMREACDDLHPYPEVQE
jgi:hypothetical protein